jgi:hypothetical protein
VDVQDQRIALLGVEAGRLEDPGLDGLPVEARVHDLLRRADQHFGEEGFVDARQAARRAHAGAENEEVPDLGRGRKDESDAATVGRGGIGDDFLVPGGERVHLAGGDVDALQVRAPVIRRADVDGRAVATPDRARGQAAPRRTLIAGEPTADVPVVGPGQEARRSLRSQVRHVQLGLVVGAHLLAAGHALERDALAVGAERELPDRAVDARGQ